MKNIRKILGVILLISILFTLILTGCDNENPNIIEGDSETPITNSKIENDSGNEKELEDIDSNGILSGKPEVEDELSIPQSKEEPIKEHNENQENEETNVTVTGELKVHFVDVGQGDSALIKAGDKAMLIDAGDRGYGPGIVSYLKSQDVKGLDYLILTHPHADHIGGAADIIKAFEVEKIIMPKVSHTTQTFENLLITIKDKGLKITSPNPGDEYELGNSSFKILAPNSSSYKNMNDYSVVTKIIFGNTAFLFTGDAESTSENQMVSGGLDLKSDVLKIGHHGSDTSTTDRFLKSVAPSFAVISVGDGNKYGHPIQSVLDRLGEQGIELFRTDKNNTIVATSDGENITFTKGIGSVAKSSSGTQGTKSKAESEPKKDAESTAKSETDNKEEVYITNTGKKYHTGSCRHLKSSKIPISLEDAKSGGYEPCKTCNPKK